MAVRRVQAAREIERLRKSGRAIAPVVVQGRKIARTFWGQAWCRNLEAYSDFANRLPRGRSYVRNGFVVHLEVRNGRVEAFVSGKRLYTVRVGLAPVPRAVWAAICRDCVGAIDSLVELLQGRFAESVMDRLCRPRTGLFPSPDEIELACSCPDQASMCKHVAAVLYGIGQRLDVEPHLLFRLRGVDESDLIGRAGDRPLAGKSPDRRKVLARADVSELFGIEMESAGQGERSGRKTAKGKGKGKEKGKAKAKAKGRQGRRSGTRQGPSRGRKRSASHRR